MEKNLKAQNGYYPALTGLRALAAWAVFVHHHNLVSQGGDHGFWKNFLYEFHTGVTVFFVLSGFLITLRYYEGMNAGKIRFREYFINRFARVYPMYFLLTTATFIAGAMGMPRFEPPGFFDLQHYAMHISFLRGFFDDLWFTGVTQGWTLSVEECFYLSAPLIFWLARKGRFMLWIQPALLLASGFLLVLIFRNVDFKGFMDNNTFMLLRTFFGRCLEFFIGIQLALWFMKNPQGRSRGSWFTWAGFLFIFICIAGLALVKGPYEQGLYHPAGIVINNLVLPLGIAVLLWGLCKEDSVLSRLLDTGVFQLLGKSSYTFYLIHMGILNTFFIWYVTDNTWLNFIGMNVAAIVLFKALEEPLNKGLRKLKGA